MWKSLTSKINHRRGAPTAPINDEPQIEASSSRQQSISAVPQHKPAEVTRTGSYLGPSLMIKGEISAQEDLRIDSQVDAVVRIEAGSLTIGDRGRVCSSVAAREVQVLGTLTGHVLASRRVELKASSNFSGTIQSPCLVVDEGAILHGTFEIRAEHQAAGNRETTVDSK